MQIKFDLEKPTARELSDALKGVRQGKATAIAEVLSNVVVECPKAWGDPATVATYSDAAISERLAPAFQALRDTLANFSTKLDGVTFDLAKVTPREFDNIMASADTNDVPVLASLLSNFVKSCPPEWGDPKAADTYLNLKYYTQFRPLALQLAGAGQGEMLNFLK
jgi:hypothetical protein